MPPPPVPPDLMDVYRRTHYAVFPFGPDEGIVFALKVDEHSPQFEQLIEDVVGTATDFALLTAFNPGSQLRDDETNFAEHERLRALLSTESRQVWEAVGWLDEGGDRWEEPMWLVIGISRERALDHGRAFGQNAILHGQPGQPVQLLLCHDQGPSR